MTLIEAGPMLFGMFIVTFGVRYGVLAWAGRRDLPTLLQRALEYVPVAVLTALIVPMMLLRQGEWAIGFDNPWLIAGIASAVFVAWTRKALLTIVFGMGLFLLLRGIGG